MIFFDIILEHNNDHHHLLHNDDHLLLHHNHNDDDDDYYQVGPLRSLWSKLVAPELDFPSLFREPLQNR